MRPLRYQFPNARVILATAAAAFAFPPPRANIGVLPAWVNSSDSGVGVPPQFDLEIWGDQASSITGAELVGAVQRPFTFADVTITSADNTTDRITKNGHGFVDGDGPVMLTGATPPTGLDAVTPYYVIKIDANVFQLAASVGAALAGTAVPFSTNGSGTIKVVAVAATTAGTGTQRCHWHSLGLLQDPIAVDAQRGFTARVDHRSSVIAYALVASATAGGVCVAMTPVQDLV